MYVNAKHTSIRKPQLVEKDGKHDTIRNCFADVYQIQRRASCFLGSCAEFLFFALEDRLF